MRTQKWQRVQHRLVRHHLILALVSSCLAFAVFRLVDSKDSLFRLSMASAYTGLILLGATLLIGPWNVLRARPNPVSTDLRRDIGIWAAIVGLAHVMIGLQVHFHGRPWLYFLVYLPSAINLRHLPLRRDLFGFANHFGLVATLILALLVLLSNDISLRMLKVKRWKMLQRFNYVLFLFVVAHGVLYQRLEHRLRLYVVAFGLIVLVVMNAQLVGAWRRMRRPINPAKAGEHTPG